MLLFAGVSIPHNTSDVERRLFVFHTFLTNKRGMQIVIGVISSCMDGLEKSETDHDDDLLTLALSNIKVGIIKIFCFICAKTWC